MKESRVVFSSAQSFCVCFFIIFFYQRLPTAKPNVCFAFYSLILLFESIYYYFMFISAFIQRVFFCAVCRSLNNSFTSIFRFAYIITEWFARLLWLLLFFLHLLLLLAKQTWQSHANVASSDIRRLNPSMWRSCVSVFENMCMFVCFVACVLGVCSCQMAVARGIINFHIVY